MRYAMVLVASSFLANACLAEELPRVSATRDGKKMQLPQSSVQEGVKVTLALLESCHDQSGGTIEDLKKAREGDHLRFVFKKPVTASVGRSKFEVTELVLTQPLNTGVFWLQVGDKVVRCTKFTFAKQKDFDAWQNEAKFAE